MEILSAAQILWDNWDKYDNLDQVYREGFLKIRAYGYGDEARDLMDRYHAETTLIHSFRAALLFSDIMDLYPSYYKDVDKYTALKVALNHDIGELVVGDVCDDGRQEHEDKKYAEWAAVERHYFCYEDETYLRYKAVHREFEDSSTFLGQSIRMADKLDFIAKLIKLESRGYNLGQREHFAHGDFKYAEEINCYNFIDICANHLRHLMAESHFDERLTQICEQFLTCALKTVDRPFFEWWHQQFKIE